MPNQIPSTPQCTALVVLLAFPGSTGPTPTVKKAGVSTPLHCHPYPPSTSRSLPAHNCRLPSKCTTHATCTSLSLPESVGTWLQLGLGSGVMHRLWLPVGSWVITCWWLSLSATGFPWGQFWGFPLILLLSWGKQELGPPRGGMKGPLGSRLTDSESFSHLPGS